VATWTAIGSLSNFETFNHIRDNEERRANGQMSVIARDRMMFCACEQF
jgi:hypothetical protein